MIHHTICAVKSAVMIQNRTAVRREDSWSGVGLNLQSASVLVNLDIPWNPAVLEQRIARVHRLGQSETVQIVLLVADDAYEARVMELVAQRTGRGGGGR